MESEHTLAIRFRLNGTEVSAEIEPRDLLLDVLRDRFDLTGAKRSCDVQICGACTVLLDGLPVSACTLLAYEADGKSVETVEGLAHGGQLHPLQQAFLEHGALQCGFCTPGMIMSAKALLAEKSCPDREQIVAHMNGNICRCTGYVKICEAIHAAGEASRDRTHNRRAL